MIEGVTFLYGGRPIDPAAGYPIVADTIMDDEHKPIIIEVRNGSMYTIHTFDAALEGLDPAVYTVDAPDEVAPQSTGVIRITVRGDRLHRIHGRRQVPRITLLIRYGGGRTYGGGA